MILGTDRIADLLELDEVDPLVITPEPDTKRLRTAGASSVDLRLGTWFVTMRQARMSHLDIEDSTGTPTYSKLTKTRYVPFGESFFLHPRSFVLGTTLEWIRLPANLAGNVIGRSRWGRRGLVIATAIGVHPGFTGCLTLELSNVGEIPIEITPGMSICQLALHEVRSKAKDTDQSAFMGQRMPVVGKLSLDPIAKELKKGIGSGLDE